MSGISSGVGLVSGINYASLISQLVAIDEQPQNIVQSQINETNTETQAYQGLASQLGSIQTITNDLALPQSFAAATTSSSNTGVLTATAQEGAAVGSYQFQVAQLVSTQQVISGGFSSSNSLVGAGTITIEEGNGLASNQTLLSQLNGGQGVQRGEFKITDRSGASGVVNISDAVSLDDVVNDINSASGVNVRASLSDNGIVLTDTSGGSGTLSVADLNGGTAAASLGIAGSATAGSNVLTGSNINTISDSTELANLNDGRGVQALGGSSNDFQIATADGSTINVSVAASQTVGDLLKAINTAGGGKIVASLGTDGRSIKLTDTTTGTGTFAVTALGGSKAASELGILGTGSGGVIAGSDVAASLDSVLVSSLNGGQGFTLGSLNITSGTSTLGTINLSSASSVSDVISTINNAGLGLEASLNSSGTGIQIINTTGGNVTIQDGDSNKTAEDLGIAGTINAGQTADGTNLQRQYVTNNTLLSQLNGGTGVNLGTFTISNSKGTQFAINLANGSFSTVGDVISAINSQAKGVTASINSTGNGILLTDTAGGSGKLAVIDDDGGSTAADLNIAGTATGTTINGAFQKTIAVTSTDTLATVQSKINSLGFGVTANIINDGSQSRLSLTSVNSGKAGQVIVDGGTTNLNPTTLVAAQDAAVFLGGNGSAQPLLITSSTNQITNVIKGVTVNLLGASSQPVTLSVTPDTSGVESDLTNFVQDFNALINQIGTYTQFNTNTNQGGLLLGDDTVDQIQEVLYNAINSTVSGNGQYNSLASIGITIGDNAQLSFDPNQFEQAFATDPSAVTNLFSQTTTGLGNVLSKAVTSLTDPVSGLITLQESTLNTRVQNYQSYYNELNTLVQQQQQQLETQFANLESQLATYQSQGAVLGTLSSSLSSLGSSSSSASSTPSASSSSSG